MKRFEFNCSDLKLFEYITPANKHYGNVDTINTLPCVHICRDHDNISNILHDVHSSAGVTVDCDITAPGFL